MEAHAYRLTKIRQNKKLNLNPFIYDLISINWDRFHLIPNVKDAWYFLYTEFINVVDKHAPWKTVRLGVIISLGLIVNVLVFLG